MTTRCPRAIGYLRVSTDQQSASGLGLDAQADAITQAAARHGLTVAESFTDAGVSGTREIEDRPGLLAAVAALRRGDVLLVSKRDRLGRDVIAVALIERLIARKGCRIVSAAGEGTETDDPSGLLMRRMMDVIAEHEARVISARTKAALKAKRQRGERTGNLPYGFSVADDGRTLIANPNERPALDAIRQLRADGQSLRVVADTLNAQGFVTRAGTPWRFEYVRSVLAHAA